jgi:hypothetical protein
MALQNHDGSDPVSELLPRSSDCRLVNSSNVGGIEPRSKFPAKFKYFNEDSDEPPRERPPDNRFPDSDRCDKCERATMEPDKAGPDNELSLRSRYVRLRSTEI